MVDKEALFLAKYFIQQYRIKHPNRSWTLSSIKRSNMWQYFMKAAEKFSNDKRWDARIFVLTAFEGLQNVYPPMLPTKRVWDNFLEYRHRFIDVYDEKKLAGYLLSTYNKVREWSKENGYEKPNFKAFFEDEKIRFFIQRNMFYMHLFTLCKNFKKWYDTLEDKDFFPPLEFMAKRALIFENKKILNLMKKVLGEEFA